MLSPLLRPLHRSEPQATDSALAGGIAASPLLPLHLHDHLPGIAAGEQLQESPRHSLNTVTGRDVVLNLSAGDQRRHPLPELPCYIEVIAGKHQTCE